MLTDDQVTALARFNLFVRGGRDRRLPQVLPAEKVAEYYSKRAGVEVTVEDAFRVLARHNAMSNTVPILTRAMAVTADDFRHFEFPGGFVDYMKQRRYPR